MKKLKSFIIDLVVIALALFLLLWLVAVSFVLVESISNFLSTTVISFLFN